MTDQTLTTPQDAPIPGADDPAAAAAAAAAATPPAAPQGETGASPDPAPFYNDLPRKQADFLKSRGYESLDKLVSSHIHAQKVISAQGKENMIFKPSASREEDPDSWQAYDEAMGIPATADDYEFPSVEGFTVADEHQQNVKDLFHKHGVPKDAFGPLMESLMGLQASVAGQVPAAAAAELEKMGADLRAEWGANYDANVQSAQGAIRAGLAQAGGEDFLDYLDQSKLSSDPRMIRFMHSMSKLIGNDGGLPGDTAPGGRGIPTLAEADRAISDHRDKYAKALSSKNHPDHKSAVAQLTSLYEQREQAEATQR